MHHKWKYYFSIGNAALTGFVEFIDVSEDGEDFPDCAGIYCGEKVESPHRWSGILETQ